MRFSVIVVGLLLASCKTVPFIKTPKASVMGVPDAGKPATIDTGDTKKSFDVPAETTYTVVRTEATPTVPAQVVETWKFDQPTRFEETASTLKADTGTVDTTVALRRVDVDAKKPLLYVAIGLMVFAAAAVYAGHPTIATAFGAGSALAFMTWKLADLPPYLWACAAFVGVGLYFGYKKKNDNE